MKLGLHSDFRTNTVLNKHGSFSYIWDSNSRFVTVRNLGKLLTWCHSGPVFFSSVKCILIHSHVHKTTFHLSTSYQSLSENDNKAIQWIILILVWWSMMILSQWPKLVCVPDTCYTQFTASNMPCKNIGRKIFLAGVRYNPYCYDHCCQNGYVVTSCQNTAKKKSAVKLRILLCECCCQVAVKI